MNTTNKILLGIICLLIAGTTFLGAQYISQTHFTHTHDHSITITTESNSDVATPESGSAKPISNSAVEEPDDILLTSPYLGSYTIEDATHGNKTSVSVTDSTRTITTNTLPNHTHGDFPGPGNPNEIAAIANSYTFPAVPSFTGIPKEARQAIVGINGIPFEPGTAEQVTCASGEEYKVVGLQDMLDLGMDMNNAHVQPTGLYHYHGSPTGLIEFADQDTDLVHVGFAADGHMLYYSKNGAYTSSYSLSTTPRSGTSCVVSGPSNSNMSIASTIPDGSFEEDWTYRQGSGDLDECNGTTINGQYMYVVTEEYPFISRCLMGEFEEETRPARPSGQPGDRPGNR